MNKPKVSILIPVYNREEYIQECIESAIRQTYTDYEIVVIDNASTDNTWNVLQRYAELDVRIRVLRNEFNVGPVKNWERCIKEARGEYGKILFSDDILCDNFIENTLPYIERNDNCAFVFTRYAICCNDENVGVSVGFSGKSGFYPAKKFIKESLYGNNAPLSPWCAIFRTRDLVKSIDTNLCEDIGYDFNRYGAGPDVLLYLQTLSNYSCFYYVNDNLVRYRSHVDSITISQSIGRLSYDYNLAKLWYCEKYEDVNTCRKFIASNLIKRLLSKDDYGLSKFVVKYKLKFGRVGIISFLYVLTYKLRQRILHIFVSC